MNQSAPTPRKAPKSRGRIMDFTPRRPISNPASQPVIKMPAATSRSATPHSTAPHPVASQPAVPHPAASYVATSQPASPRPAPHPTRTPKPAPTFLSRPIRKRPLSQPAPRPVPQSTPTPQPIPAPQSTPPSQSAPDPITPSPKQPAPLGARSPFLKSSVVVEKRPLSGGAPTSTRSRTSRHQAVADYPHPQIARSVAIKPASRKSKLPLFLLIAGTILIGAAVGACAYFLVFQGE